MGAIARFGGIEGLDPALKGISYSIAPSELPLTDEITKMTPQQIAVQAKQYWKEHYPESCRTLEQYNQLDSEAPAADFTSVVLPIICSTDSELARVITIFILFVARGTSFQKMINVRHTQDIHLFIPIINILLRVIYRNGPVIKHRRVELWIIKPNNIRNKFNHICVSRCIILLVINFTPQLIYLSKLILDKFIQLIS